MFERYFLIKYLSTKIVINKAENRDTYSPTASLLLLIIGFTVVSL